MIRAKAKDAGWLLFIAAPYILVSAFLTQRTGFAPQARPLVAVIWVLAIFMGGFIAGNGDRVYRLLFNGAVGFSFFAAWLLCRNPLALYQETTSGATERAGAMFLILSNLHVNLPDFLPSFIKVGGRAWTPNVVWIAGLGMLVAAYFMFRGPKAGLSFAGHAVLALTLLSGFFAMYVFFPRTVLTAPRTVTLPEGGPWTFYSQSQVARMGEAAKFALLQDDRDYFIFFTTPEPLPRLDVEFGSPFGDYVFRLLVADDQAIAMKTRREVLVRSIVRPPAYPWKGASLYQLSIRLENKSAARTGVTPYILALSPGR
jgi:hypothetical protein